MSALEIEDADRPEISFAEMQKFLHLGFGKRGIIIANAWQLYNNEFWQGRLKPIPIFLPHATSYGSWIGACVHNENQVLNIQIKHGMDMQNILNTLLHEMVHQALIESEQNAAHNALPWCQEIMRISQDYFDISFWAAPALPRKVDGCSVRLQKESPDGEISISRHAIARWPRSVQIHAPLPTTT
ncbi:MAG: hypothetical protein AAGF93_01450 [Cyanobacteria bacterium P01_H01_bin.105]